jgi:Uma2 family endonuclease
MNEIVRQPYTPHETTQAAEGLPRLKWTLAEFEHLSELGFFGGIDRPRERIELIDGELVPMAAKGVRHERVRGQLQNYLVRRVDDSIRVFNEPGWRPGGERYFEPEIVMCQDGFQPDNVPPGEVLLLIEVSDSSLRYDTTKKADIYATLGVTEYWVIDANTLETRIHRSPTADGYTDVTPHPSTDALTPSRVPALLVRLADLGLDG